jgi:hypothetical protein
MLRRRDLDDESLRRAATIVVSTRDQIKNDEPIWLTGRSLLTPDLTLP